MTCLDTITVEEFKAQFPRDFLFLSVWSAGTYNTGDIVLYDVDGITYYCLQDGVTSTPDTLGADWRVATDAEKDEFVLDSDIEKAFMEAKLSFNEGLPFADCTQTKFVFYYLTAHYLTADLLASQQNGAPSRVVNSRSVGSVSESYDVPDIYKNDPLFNLLSTTYYGSKYLGLVVPMTRGNVVCVVGRSTPW